MHGRLWIVESKRAGWVWVVLVALIWIVHRWMHGRLLGRHLELNHELGIQLLIPRHNDFSALAKGRQWLGTDEEEVGQVNLSR